MGTFTLLVWLYVGLRYEEVQITDLDRNACKERLRAVESSRFLAFQQQEDGRREPKGKCVGSRGSIAPRTFEPAPRCAQHPCGSPVPGEAPMEVITPRVRRV
jgi:hypothetical protein